MPSVNHARQELHLKIVYYGPGLGGKTTNLEWIHARSKPEHRGKLISLNTESERTLFFDLLPMELGVFRGYKVRLHLCTVPGQIAQDRTRQLVLRHVDGVVFVIDSQSGRLVDNAESMHNLEVNLGLLGLDPKRVPTVIQFNKRDLPNAIPIEILENVLELPEHAPGVEASAVQGVGVSETLKLILKTCLQSLGDPSRAPEGRSPSILPGVHASAD